MSFAALLLLAATAAPVPPTGPVDLSRAPPTADPAPTVPPPPIEPREDNASDAGVAAPIPNLALSVAVEPQPVKFGDPFFLVITITRDRGLRLEIPGALPEVAAAPKTGDPVRTVEDLAADAQARTPGAPAVDAGPAPARVRETIKIPFLALDTQEVKTPAFVLTGKDGATVDVPALEVKVTVDPDHMDAQAGTPGAPPDAGPLPPGTVVLEPAAPAIAYAVPDARPFVVLGAFATSGLLFGAVRFAARRRKLLLPKAAAVPPPPPRPAHEIALERLEALLASGLLQRGETGVFVERLMDEVLRDYIAARFALPAGARTTRELVKELLGVAVLGLDVGLIEGLLADADLVKFAKASIPAERANAMASRVRALVDATKLVPVKKEGA